MAVRRLPTLAPAPDALGPARKRALHIGAPVELLVAVETDVHEVGGDVFVLRPLARRICDHQGDTMLAQQGDEGRVDEGVVADFHRVPQWSRRPERDAGTTLDLGVAASRQR